MEVFLPVNLEEALQIKSARPECVPIAGGTDVMIDLNFGRRRPLAMVDLCRVPEFLEWKADESTIFVGSGVSYSRIISEMPAMPPLAAACRTIGSPQIRNRGTLGGNLATASPAGDALPVLAVFDADVVVSAADRGQRAISWREFLTGPKRTSLEADELILGVRWDRVRGPGVFSKIGARNAMVIAITSLCLILDEDERRTRLSVGSVAPTVIRVPEVELLLDDILSRAGAWDDPERSVASSLLADAERVLQASIHPIDDVRSSAAYRRHSCGVLLGRALKWALQERRRNVQERPC